MKKIFNPFFVLLLLLTACSKTETQNTTGGGSPLPLPTPSIAWTVSLTDNKRGDTAFYEEVKNLTITVLNADSFGIVGASGSSVTTGQIISPITYSAIAKNSAGTRVTSTKTIPVFSETKTNIVGGILGVKWGMDSSFIQFIPDSLSIPSPTAWTPGLIDSNRYRFFTDNTATVFITVGPAPGQYPGIYSLVMPGNVPPYNETHFATPGDDLRRIETSTATKLVFTQRKKVINGVGYVIYRWVYSPKP